MAGWLQALHSSSGFCWRSSISRVWFSPRKETVFGKQAGLGHLEGMLNSQSEVTSCISVIVAVRESASTVPLPSTHSSLENFFFWRRAANFTLISSSHPAPPRRSCTSYRISQPQTNYTSCPNIFAPLRASPLRTDAGTHPCVPVPGVSGA